jgi:MBG domain (YGX type)/Bacterial Ig domain
MNLYRAHPPAPRKWVADHRRKLTGAGLGLVLLTATTLSLVTASSVAASGTAWYAYGAGGASAPTSCPETATSTSECTLAQALSLAGAGDTVYLATSGASGTYLGNWSVSPTGTSSSAPLTIEPASGVANPTLSGNGGSSTGCTTSSCAGPVLTVGDAFVDISGATIEDGDNTATSYGGAIENMDGGTLSITGSIFSGNSASTHGGAIANGDNGTTGTLTVSNSTFTDNTAGSFDGGAIDSGDAVGLGVGGQGFLTISGSTFSGNNAGELGGAIANGVWGGTGTSNITTSTFSGNHATYDGGAIDTGDTGGAGTLSASQSTFTANTAGAVGNTIDNGDNNGTGALWVAADIFNGSCTRAGGTWHDEGFNVGSDGTCLSSTPATGDVDHGSSLTSLLGALANNGGPTGTVLPSTGNPAIGLIPNLTSVTLDGTAASLCPTTDQRGTASTPGAACDAGAVQLLALYAYAAGTATSPTNCASTTTAADECTLAQALSLATAGDTVYLATPGTNGHYVGTWSVHPTGTSAGAPLTLEPAPGVTDPILDGNHGSSTGCATSSCNGPVLRIGDAHVDIDGITVENGYDTLTSPVAGGGIDNSAGGTLSVTGSVFSGDVSQFDGGAIDNGDDGGSGTLVVTGSTFSANTAIALGGGAIDNGDNNGTGTATISTSTFSGNVDEGVGGGAILNGSDGGSGVLSVTTSTFAGNSATAGNGGAIDNADNFATAGTVSVSSSTFSANTASADGASIANGDDGSSGAVWAAADIFNGGCHQGTGSWHDEGYNVGSDSTCLSSTPATDDVDYGSSLPLGPLANNGGSTETVLALAGNPAIGIIASSTSVTLNSLPIPLCPTTDQRGVASAIGAPCNAGAVQYALPVATALSYEATQGTELTETNGSLLAGVTDDNPGATTWTSALSAPPSHGTASVNSDGSFTYSPNPGFVGADSFTYTATDNLGYTSAPATVSIDVVPAFSITVDGSTTTATVVFGGSVTFGETGMPASATGALDFLTSPGAVALCSLRFPTGATTCAGGGTLAPGDYTVTANFTDSSDVTTPATGTVQLDVTTVPVVASVSGTQAYGSSSHTLSYTDNAPTGVGLTGTLACTNVDGGEPISATLTASSYTIDGSNCSGLSLTGTGSSNYSLSYVGLTGGFVVTQVPLTVTASSANFTYGGTVPAITPGYAGFVNGDIAGSLTTAPTCSLTATSSTPVGTYSSSCSGAADTNYTISYVPGTVTVTPAPLTVTASSATFTYGGTVPAITAQYSGFVDDDTMASLTAAPSCSTTATSSSQPRAYTATCTGATSRNYDISYIDGTVTVSPAPLVITASSASMTYLGPVPAIMPGYSGFVAGDTVASLTQAPACSTTATSLSVPGTYPSACSGTVDPDYDISYVQGTVTVTARSPAPTGTATTTTTTTTPGPPRRFPDADLSYPNGALVNFASGHYVLAGGRAFLASTGELTALEKVDHAKILLAPVGADPPTAASLRSGTLISTKAVNGAGTVYVAGVDDELHGFATPGQFFDDGYDAALVVSIPSLAGFRIGTTAGAEGAAANALATRADGALVDSAGTFYLFAGGRAFGIATPADLLRLQNTDKAVVLNGSVGPPDTRTSIAGGVLLSSPGKVYLSYRGELYPFKTLAQLANDGYGGTAAVPVPGNSSLVVVSPYVGS